MHERPPCAYKSTDIDRSSASLVKRADKGGDPAARSRTATLLRLHPNYRAQLGAGSAPGASVAADFHGVTGGVYKARERIHRGVLIRDY